VVPTATFVGDGS
jgi:hypothetical protein